ncbi:MULTISPECIES: hypothetical protein [Sphingomonas]|uniref:hypothetical protein n=1 Tax=Sphingomonas TaxID=13687 RepID=UPI000AC20EC4|nr:hypothetical protein [Sphingomonas sp. CCH10-B3]
MATIATPHGVERNDDRFFLTMAFVMAGVLVAGFSLNLAMGRSTFARPLLVHAHAIIFMGWIVIYLAQNWFATQGPIALHRRFGWVAVGWLCLMLYFGTAVTVMNVRAGTVPFFFQPLHMLVFDPLSLIGCMALIGAGIAQRKHTGWHRRLNYCGMALLVGPGVGRLLPMPLLIPYAYQAAFWTLLIFPIIGMIADWRRDGRVHPAWFWGLGGMIATEALTNLITFTPIGLALYEAVTAGSPGAAIAPLAFPPSPLG